MIRRDKFELTDLVKVEHPEAFVVLASGGPLMRVECVEGEKALCSWTNQDGLLARSLFSITSLRRLTPVTPTELEAPIR